MSFPPLYTRGPWEPASTAPTLQTAALISHTHSPQGLPDAVSVAALMGGGWRPPLIAASRRSSPSTLPKKGCKAGGQGLYASFTVIPREPRPACACCGLSWTGHASFHQFPRLGRTSKALCWKGVKAVMEREEPQISISMDDAAGYVGRQALTAV